jgi:hypothetical protein
VFAVLTGMTSLFCCIERLIQDVPPHLAYLHGESMKEEHLRPLCTCNNLVFVHEIFGLIKV